MSLCSLVLDGIILATCLLHYNSNAKPQRSGVRHRYIMLIIHHRLQAPSTTKLRTKKKKKRNEISLKHILIDGSLSHSLELPQFIDTQPTPARTYPLALIIPGTPVSIHTLCTLSCPLSCNPNLITVPYLAWPK